MADGGVSEAATAEGAKSAGEATAATAETATAADASALTASSVAATIPDAVPVAAGSGATAAGTGGLLTGVGKALSSPLGAVGLGEAAGAVTTSLLAPKPPSAPAPLPMPDPLAQQNAQRQAVIEQLARRGRASTILTSPGDSLGG